MTDDEVESLYRQAMEFWGRCEPTPKEIEDAFVFVPEEQRSRVFDRIWDEAINQ